MGASDLLNLVPLMASHRTRFSDRHCHHIGHIIASVHIKIAPSSNTAVLDVLGDSRLWCGVGVVPHFLHHAAVPGVPALRLGRRRRVPGRGTSKKGPYACVSLCEYV